MMLGRKWQIILNLGLITLVGIMMINVNAVGQELDLTKVGVKVGDKFGFRVEKNNMTHPVKNTHQPFWTERCNDNAPMYEEAEEFNMTIDEINGEFITATFSDGFEDVQETGGLAVVRRGLVIAIDWEYWIDYPPEVFNGEVLIAGIYYLQTKDLGDTFSFNLSIRAFSGEIDKQIEVVTYDKDTGVVREIHILKTFNDEERPIEECLFQQISDYSEDDQIPDSENDQYLFTSNLPVVHIALSALLILGIARGKSKR